MKLNFLLLFCLAIFLFSCPENKDRTTGDDETETAAIPTALPTGGTFTSVQTVELSTETEGAVIRYTTDGSNPTVDSSIYNASIIVTVTTTIKAIAVKEGMESSSIMSEVYTINIPPQTFTVNVFSEPADGGTVSRNPEMQNYPAGTKVIVTAAANNGFVFSNWTGTPVDAVESGNTIEFTVNAHVTQLTAHFQPFQPTYTLTVNAGSGGTVEPSGTSTRNANESVTVTATANNGYTFSSWTGAPASVNPSNASITFNMNSNVTLTANFQAEGTTPIVRERLNVDYAPLPAPRRHARQRYDLRLPDTGEGPFPLLIYVHGGGFTGGEWRLSSNNNGLVSRARSNGYAVASVGYLLMTGNQRTFPENVEDVLAAVRHLRANAAEYRLDPDRFAISGFSAGAYLTAIVCALSGAQDHLYDVTSLGNAGVSYAVQAAASSAALTDFSVLNSQETQLGINCFLNHDSNPEGALLGGHLQNDKDTEPMKTYLWMQNPLTHVSAVTPPIYMLHGTSDNLVPYLQSRMMVNKINEFAPGRAVENIVTGRGHNDFDTSATAALNVTILNFLDEALGIQR